MSEELIKETKKIEESDITDSDQIKSLVLYNDDYHSFDYVIETLIEVCRHDYSQAEQCTLIAHFKGKCDVKAGSYNELKPMKEGLTAKELIADIE